VIGRCELVDLVLAHAHHQEFSHGFVKKLSAGPMWRERLQA
jgi:hypothetical protein